MVFLPIPKGKREKINKRRRYRYKRKSIINKAKEGDEQAVEHCKQKLKMRVYSQAEIDAEVKRRPELTTIKNIGNTYWDTRMPIDNIDPPPKMYQKARGAMTTL